MSIRVIVSSDHSSDCNLLKDVETEKRNEWNRRRLLRIQQVRQQSKDFANSLREKIHGECDFQKENSNKQWQEKTLDRLTERYRDCLKDIGLAHAKAAKQPDPDEILREERLRNAVMTGIRGESAMCLLKCRQQMKKLEETVPTRLKAFVRAKEDLRSTMVASLPQPQPRPKKSPVKKKCSPVKRVVATKQKKPRHVLKEIPSNLPKDYVIERVPDDDDELDKCCGGVNVIDYCNDKELAELELPKHKCHCSPNRGKKATATQVSESKTVKPTHQKRKDVYVQDAKFSKEGTRRQRRYSDEWRVDDDPEDSYDSDATWPPRSRRSSSSGQQVHCYDHSNRHLSSRQAPSVTSFRVKRVVAPAGESAGVRSVYEADMRECETRMREERMRDEQRRRGEEALLRQQRRRDFDRLMIELSKLSREERKLRYTNWTKASTELGDTQRTMATKMRQKKMESAFETEFMDPVIEDENKKEPVRTPKLNVAEWKKSECVDTIEVSRAKQNDKLTLSNLLKRIDEQREMLFQEIRDETDDRKRAVYQPIDADRDSKSDDRKRDVYQPIDADRGSKSDDRKRDVYQPIDADRGSKSDDRKRDVYQPIDADRGSKSDDRKRDVYHPIDADRGSKSDDRKRDVYQPIDADRGSKSDDRKRDVYQPIDADRGSKSDDRKRDVYQPIDADRGSKSDDRKRDVYQPIDADRGSKSDDRKRDVNQPIDADRGSKSDRNSADLSNRKTSCSTTSNMQDIGAKYNPHDFTVQSSASYKQDSRDASGVEQQSALKKGRVDKVVENGNVSKDDCKKASKNYDKREGNTGDDEKNSDSSLSTLYSLDMALAQTVVEKHDDKDDGSTEMKGLRITLKVTGCKEYKDKKKKKTKTEEEKLLKECRKLLEDKGNMRKRDVSGETTSTSYRSPPDRLSPKQLQLLRDLLKQIEEKPDKKGMPLLKRYIIRLLSMNRESIDCLGVSSSDVSLQSSLMREMAGNIEDSRNLEFDDVTTRHASCEEKGVQVSLVDCSTNIDTRKQRKNSKVDSTNPYEEAKKDGGNQKRSSKVDDNEFEDASNYNRGKERSRKSDQSHQQASSAVDGDYHDNDGGLDDLDVLTQQINKYFQTKQNDKSDEIVKKYMELAKRYTDRISNLADLIGDVDSDVPSSLIKTTTDQESTDSTKTSQVESSVRSYSPIGSQTYNETSYMTLPPEVKVKVPLPPREIEPLQRASPTFHDDNRQDQISWHEALTKPVPTRISPAPDEARWFRPKPPPTILNNHSLIDPELRTSSPHELSTIHEVDTPSTSWLRDQMATSSPRKRSRQTSHQHSGYLHPPENESIPLDDTPRSPSSRKSNQHKVTDDSFQTLKSDENSGSVSDFDLEGKNIVDESMPDVMEELIRRNIVSSPYGWLKELQEREAKREEEREEERKEAQDVADEEVRRIMRESPEDLEAALKDLGIGWASTTLRKTRQAEELSGESSSPPAAERPTGTPLETSTPQSERPKVWPVLGSETEISAIRLVASSSSELALTPPDISLKPPQLSLSSNSSDHTNKR